ncbi:hypothetical protein DL96DRAFT_1705369 [Flagelloscypha sp. PMI_526]|nr:hypothetical protein DL96DRAFT_1705369 [Flagelloscypha sp. PMI_526]
MTSSSAEVSSPTLPMELELRIFETCYLMYPDTLQTLFLVSRRSFQSINSIRYVNAKLSNQVDIAKMTSWLNSQPPRATTGIQPNVKTMLINFPVPILYRDIEKIIKSCDGLQHLALWLSSESSSLLDGLVMACLSLPNLRCLSLSTGSETHIRNVLSNLKTNDSESPRIVLIDTLRYVDWGRVPSLPMSTFPSVEYVLMQPLWPLHEDHMTIMEEWIHLPGSKGLILLLDDDDMDEAVGLGGQHPVLSNEKVVLAPAPENWVQEWVKHCSGDPDAFFAIGERLAGNYRLEHRIWRRKSEKVS